MNTNLVAALSYYFELLAAAMDDISLLFAGKGNSIRWAKHDQRL
jgi:hypothetical protein